MEMQRKSEQGQDKQFAELVENLSSLVSKLGQADIEQMVIDLKELVNNSQRGNKEYEETTKSRGKRAYLKYEIH